MPDAQGWRYIDRTSVPRDRAARAYLYAPPATPGARSRIWTWGADGRPGGRGEDADIVNLEIE